MWYEGICINEKARRSFRGQINTLGGRRMAQGTCPICNNPINRILKDGE